MQKKWQAIGGSSAHRAVLNDPGYSKSSPFAAAFLESMNMVVDFWAEPSYAELLQAMQKRVHEYVVVGHGTSQEAMDGLLQDWKATFAREGKLEPMAPAGDTGFSDARAHGKAILVSAVLLLLAIYFTTIILKKRRLVITPTPNDPTTNYQKATS